MIFFVEAIFIVIVVVFLYSYLKKVLSKTERDSRIIKKSDITQQQWDEVFNLLPILKGLSDDEVQTLKELSIVFIHNKTFEGAQGFEVTPKVLLVISLQACLPILNIGLGCYKNFSTIIVYPSGFKTNRKVVDENGIVDHDRTHLLGESWLRGPVILSWSDTVKGGEIDGSNLVIHEFAHKLDMQNGVANGFPPLHNDMKIKDWVNEFSKAFEYFKRKCNQNDLYGIDCYAATSPAEFFSVFSEVFFEQPDKINKHFPQVYVLLELYYRQTPISRLSHKNK